jgi:hypothetical protein
MYPSFVGIKTDPATPHSRSRLTGKIKLRILDFSAIFRSAPKYIINGTKFIAFSGKIYLRQAGNVIKRMMNVDAKNISNQMASIKNQE